MASVALHVKLLTAQLVLVPVHQHVSLAMMDSFFPVALVKFPQPMLMLSLNQQSDMR